jgi:acetyl esterase
MPLDAQARNVLDQMAALDPPPVNTLPPAEVRAIYEGRPTEAGPAVARVQDHHIPSPSGDIPARIYTPVGAGPFPAMVWFHGGGWVVGSLHSTDATCRRLTNGAGCVVVSVDYRLAPEAKFPAAAKDCYTATVWMANNAAAFNTDPHRIAVGGISAGGNLAAVVALMARDRGGPPLVHQTLVVPVTDLDFENESYRQNGDDYGLTREAMIWFWDQYLSDKADANNPYAAPMKAQDLSGLPPALIITAEFDPLRDEGEAYAQRLSEAGVPTTCTRYSGMIHSFFNMPASIERAKEAIAEASNTVKAASALPVP